MLKFTYLRTYVVIPLLPNVPRISEQQMTSIKQWFTTRQRFSSSGSDIIQPIHDGPTVFLLESVPVS
jgi:hypothetical protein